MSRYNILLCEFVTLDPKPRRQPVQVFVSESFSKPQCLWMPLTARRAVIQKKNATEEFLSVMRSVKRIDFRAFASGTGGA